MKISVIMPTYECPPDLLYMSISSVLNQTHKDWELIIKDGNVENRAIDNSAFLNDCLRLYPDKFKYVCCAETPPNDQIGNFGHNGFYEALNLGIKLASGDILTLLCSDDERGDINTLRYVNEEFERHGSTPFVLYGSVDWITRNGLNFDHKTPAEVTYLSLLRDYGLYTPAIFWNKAVHQSFGYFNDRLAWCADMDFWLRCWRGINSKRTSRTLGHYRVWETSQAKANEAELCKQGKNILLTHTRAEGSY